MSSTACTSSGITASRNRSWDSEIHISQACSPDSFNFTRSRCISAPQPPLWHISLTAHESPPPPRSFIPLIRPRLLHSSIACINGSFVIGSPSWTALRNSSAPNSPEAKVTPCIPSRPVLPPTSKRTSPGFAMLRLNSRFFISPTQPTFTTQLPA